MLLTKDQLPETPSCQTSSDSDASAFSADGAGTRAVALSLLDDDDRYLPDEALASILDRYRHDQVIHRALIRRRVLSAAIVERLVRLVASRADLDALLVRHAKGDVVETDLRCARPRPSWWKTGLSAGTP